MANVITMKEALAIREKGERLKKATQKFREKAGEVTKDLVRAGEVSAVALALGWWAGRQQKAGGENPSVMGVPLDLAVGVGAHVLGIMGVGGAEEHFKAIGDGGLATYFSTLGYTAGKTGTFGASFLQSIKGEGNGVSGANLSAEDLARLATE